MKKIVLKQEELISITNKIANLDFAKVRELHCIKITDTRNKFSDVNGAILHEEFENVERKENVWVYVFNLNITSRNSAYEEVNLIDLGDDFYMDLDDGSIYKKVVTKHRIDLRVCHKVVVENERMVLRKC